MARTRIDTAGDYNPMAWVALAGFGLWGLWAWNKKKEQEAILAPQVPLKGLYGIYDYDMPILTRPGYASENYDPMLDYAASVGLDPTAFIRD